MQLATAIYRKKEPRWNQADWNIGLCKRYGGSITLCCRFFFKLKAVHLLFSIKARLTSLIFVIRAEHYGSQQNRLLIFFSGLPNTEWNRDENLPLSLKRFKKWPQSLAATAIHLSGYRISGSCVEQKVAANSLAACQTLSRAMHHH